MILSYCAKFITILESVIVVSTPMMALFSPINIYVNHLELGDMDGSTCFRGRNGNEAMESKPDFRCYGSFCQMTVLGTEKSAICP